MSSAAAPVVAEPTSTFDTDVESRRRDGDADYDGWFCVRTDPFPCPVPDCTFVAQYMTAAHLIVVWPSTDDSSMFGMASLAKEVGRNPRIIEYHPDFGPCIPWDQWDKIGRPIHGRLERPDGWDDRPSRL